MDDSSLSLSLEIIFGPKQDSQPLLLPTPFGSEKNFMILQAKKKRIIKK
jgi:hypothetical protein